MSASLSAAPVLSSGTIIAKKVNTIEIHSEPRRLKKYSGTELNKKVASKKTKEIVLRRNRVVKSISHVLSSAAPAFSSATIHSKEVHIVEIHPEPRQLNCAKTSILLSNDETDCVLHDFPVDVSNAQGVIYTVEYQEIVDQNTASEEAVNYQDIVIQSTVPENAVKYQESIGQPTLPQKKVASRKRKNIVSKGNRDVKSTSHALLSAAPALSSPTIHPKEVPIVETTCTIVSFIDCHQTYSRLPRLQSS